MTSDLVLTRSSRRSSGAFSTDIFDTKFKPLLTTEPSHSLEDVVNEGLRAEGRRFRHTLLKPGSSTGSEAEMIRAYLGRDPDPNALVKVLAAAASKHADA